MDAARSPAFPRRPWLARWERGPRPPRPGPWLTAADLGLILLLFAVSRGLILAVAAVVASWPGADPAGDLAGTLVRWDARWYVEIAVDGYPPDAAAWESGDGVNWPFFPAVPALIAALVALTGWDGATAGVVVAHALFLCGLTVFFLYARDLFGRRFARRALVLFAFWPLSVHQSVPMSEALFAPLLLACLWLARRQGWLAAGAAAAVLSATRAVGPFVAFPLLAIAARRFGLWRVLLASPGTEGALAMLAACGLGVGGFILFLDARTGDGLAFSHAQVAWGREAKWPWLTVWDALNPITRSAGALAYNAVNLAAAGGALWLAVALARLRLGAEALFVVLVVLLALSAGQTTSLPRFLGAIAPLAIPLAVACARRPRLGRALPPAFAAAMLAVAALWCAEHLYVM